MDIDGGNPRAIRRLELRTGRRLARTPAVGAGNNNRADKSSGREANGWLRIIISAAMIAKDGCRSPYTSPRAKLNHADNAVHHRITDSNQRVGAPQRKRR